MRVARWQRLRRHGVALRLTALGLLAALGSAPPVRAQRVELVGHGETWRYFKGLAEPSSPPDAWQAVAFDDSGWLTGPTGIGYGDADDATLLGDMRDAYLSLYARKAFTLADPAACAGLYLDLSYDDGFVAYLNGAEVARANMPAGPAAFDTEAASAIPEAPPPVRFDLTAGIALLQPGTNVLAVEVHNANLASSDLSFYPRLFATGPNAVTRGPFLQLHDTTSVAIAWTTAQPSLGEVEYGRGGGPGFRVTEAQPAADHLVTLTGLEPETAYAYRIAEGGRPMSATFELRTARRPYDTRFRLVVFGDSGSATLSQWNVKRLLDGLAPDLLLLVGDIIYPAGEAAGYDPLYFDPYRPLIASRPVWPVLGNHDHLTASGQPCIDAFHLPANNPAGDERYYSFRYADTLFVALDSTPNLLPGDVQFAWLEATLAASTDCYKVVFFHHPPYNSGSSHRSEQLCLDLRANLAPLFDAYGVDLVLNGHEHDYERSFPLRRGAVVARSPTSDYVDPGGTIYAVTGGGGRALTTAGTDSWTAFSTAEHHALVLDRDGPTWTLSMRAAAGSPAGAERDRMTLAKTTCAPATFNVFRSPNRSDVLQSPLAAVTARTFADPAAPPLVYFYQVDPGAELKLVKAGATATMLTW